MPLPSEETEQPSVYILIVNWNNWRDTIECLESVFRLHYSKFRVILCDNASTDDSLNQVAKWAAGNLLAGCSNSELRDLTYPHCPKPISLISVAPGEQVCLRSRTEKLVLVQTGFNHGFAGANNAGLRLALDAGDFDYVWLLNNDTVVDCNALAALIERMRLKPTAGMCGSTLLYYFEPQKVQALGGSIYHPWIARGGHISAYRTWEGPCDPKAVERKMKYVVGASMLVRKSFLDEIGLMDEAYFLYSEEIDWAQRGNRKYQLAYAPQSIVYHREGSTCGTAGNRTMRSVNSDYFSSRSRMLFTRRHFPLFAPTVATALLGGSIYRYIKGNRRGAKTVLRAMFDALMRP